MDRLNLTVGLLLDSIDDGGCFHAGVSQRRVELDDGKTAAGDPTTQFGQRGDIGWPRSAANMIDQVSGGKKQE